MEQIIKKLEPFMLYKCEEKNEVIEKRVNELKKTKVLDTVKKLFECF